MKYLIDSSAWIEYLSGSSAGEKVNEILEKEEAYTLSIIISEVISFVERHNENIEIAYESMIKNAKVVDISPRIAKKAGIFHAQIRQKIKNFGLVDALILILAQEIKAKILTGDEHFKGFKEAVFV